MVIPFSNPHTHREWHPTHSSRVALCLLQLEDKLQMICDKQVTFIEHVEVQLQHCTAESERSIENGRRAILADIRELACTTDNKFGCGSSIAQMCCLTVAALVSHPGVAQHVWVVLLSYLEVTTPSTSGPRMLLPCRDMRDRLREDLTELSEKWIELNETLEHKHRTVGCHANNVDVKVDDLTNSHEHLHKQQQAQNAQLARLSRMAEENRVDVNEKLDSLRDECVVAARVSSTAGRCATQL